MGKKVAIDIDAGVDALTLLCQELWENIFFRLDCKPLYRARCVAKGWNNVISSAISDGRRQPLPMPGGFFVSTCDSATKLRKWEYYSSSSEEKEDRGGLSSLGFLPPCNEGTIQVENACNGLILCSNNNANFLRRYPFSYKWSPEYEAVNFYLCNPLTKKWILVCKRDRWTIESAALAFDPPPNVSGQYHLKIILFLKYDDKPGISVFSSKTGQWVEKSTEYYIKGSLSHPTIRWFYLNGVVYRLATINGKTFPPKDIVLCYHIEENRFFSINLLDINLRPRWQCWQSKLWVSPVLGSMDGCLSLTTLIQDEVGKMLKVWKRDGEWILMHEIPLPDRSGIFFNSFFYIDSYTSKMEQNILAMLPSGNDKMHILRYNLIDESTRKVCSYIHRYFSPDMKLASLDWFFSFSPRPLPLPNLNLKAGTYSPAAYSLDDSQAAILENL